MQPTKINKKSSENSKTKENSSSEVETLLNKLRKTGIVSILTMNRKSQTALSSWAHDIVNQYNVIFKNSPMKLKNITELPCSKMDIKLGIKLLLLGSIEKGLDNHAVADLREKFVGLGSFQSIDKKDIAKLMKSDTLLFPEFNTYMELIISEQKALIEEINSFIEDIRKIKKNMEL